MESDRRVDAHRNEDRRGEGPGGHRVEPRDGRPGARLKAVDFDEARATAEKRTGHKPSETDLMSYLMYPEVYVKFDKARASYGDLTILPSAPFFYGMKEGDEITVDIPARRLHLHVSDEEIEAGKVTPSSLAQLLTMIDRDEVERVASNEPKTGRPRSGK